jgi:hypothetical protein
MTCGPGSAPKLWLSKDLRSRISRSIRTYVTNVKGLLYVGQKGSFSGGSQNRLNLGIRSKAPR